VRCGHDQGFAWFEAENDYHRARKALPGKTVNQAAV
jgi:hypothetical protein